MLFRSEPVGTQARGEIQGEGGLAVCFSGIAAWGQSPPVWQGILRNSAGEPLGGAIVRLAGPGGQAESVTSTNGRFQLSLPAGKYRLTVRAGHRTIDYAQLIDLAADNPAVVLTLSDRGELTLAIPQADQKTGQTTGGEQLSSQAVSELPDRKSVV